VRHVTAGLGTVQKGHHPILQARRIRISLKKQQIKSGDEFFDVRDGSVIEDAINGAAACRKMREVELAVFIFTKG